VYINSRLGVLLALSVSMYLFGATGRQVGSAIVETIEPTQQRLPISALTAVGTFQCWQEWVGWQ
jgi:hypothetical protein